MLKKYFIWDLPLRIFHWCFAITIFASWYTAENKEDYIDIHIQLGYIALGLLVFRVLWGIIGPKHARFSQFIPSPKTLFAYLKKSKSHTKTAGHNPLGAFMVILMILLIAIQTITGLFISDDIFSSGPYYSAISGELAKVLKFLHINTFNFIIAAIVLHIGAILFYWVIKKQNLVLPMITGYKSSSDVNKTDAIPHSKIILAVVIAALCAAFIYWLVVINAPVIEEFYY